MTEKDNSKLQVLSAVDRGEISVLRASELLKKSLRHTKRILKAWRKEGARALVHGNRDRAPVNSLSTQTRELILGLLKTDYVDFNNSHVASMLRRHHSIDVSRMTVSRIRDDAGLATPRRRRSPKPRNRRERMAQFGLLLQIDGSTHHWCEFRDRRYCLMGAVDDATGTVVAATFVPEESLFGYLSLMRQVVEDYGIPLAVYSDRHTIHVGKSSNLRVQQQLDGLNSSTRFAQCLSLLEVQQLFAWSPQAKGRIERLWQTFQDRLVKEMRLAGVSDIDAANRFLRYFLPEYNCEFAVAAENSESAFRQLPKHMNLDYVFSSREQRVVQADNTVSFHGKSLKITENSTSRGYAKARVEVCSLPDGRVAIAYKAKFIVGPISMDKLLAPPIKPNQVQIAKQQKPDRSKPYSPPRIPAADHPWRRTFLRPSNTKSADSDDH